VLVKAKKLHPWHLDLIRHRGEIIKRGLELKYARRKLEALRARGVDESAAWDAELACLLGDIDDQLKLVTDANEPAILADRGSDGVRRLARRTYVDHLGEEQSLITPAEASILSIARGSLTPEEFREIQSHVIHTFQFLSQIPWTRELRRVPEIARSHHEKLDGSGYPAGAAAAEIAVQTRMMTIADIFDALTASDRPYKAAVPVDRALDILRRESAKGSIDQTLLDLFITVRPWEPRKI